MELFGTDPDLDDDDIGSPPSKPSIAVCSPVRGDPASAVEKPPDTLRTILRSRENCDPALYCDIWEPCFFTSVGLFYDKPAADAI